MLQVKIYGFYTFIFFICSHIFGIGGRGLYCYHFSYMSSLDDKTRFLFIKNWFLNIQQSNGNEEQGIKEHS